MNPRIEMSELAREGVHAALGLQKYVDAHVDPTALHLLQLRASLINGCAHCIDLHTREALAAGEEARRLTGVAAWRESELYDARERSALALTETVTRLGVDGVPDDVWEPAIEHWSPEGAANLVLAIGTINLWNRMAITVRQPVPA